MVFPKKAKLRCLLFPVFCLLPIADVIAKHGKPLVHASRIGYIAKIDPAAAPKIDGVMDDIWETSYIHHIDNLTDGVVTDTNDLSGNWRALWTPTHLFLFVTVRDDVKIINDSKGHAYLDDQIEVFVTSDNKKPEDYFKPPTTNTFCYENPRAGGSVESHKKTKGFQAKVVDTDIGWNLELSIPFTDWKISPKLNDSMGIDVQINDDDTGGDRDGKLSWNSMSDAGGGSAWHPRNQGTAVFVEQAPVSISLRRPQGVVGSPQWKQMSWEERLLMVLGRVPGTELYKRQ